MRYFSALSVFASTGVGAGAGAGAGVGADVGAGVGAGVDVVLSSHTFRILFALPDDRLFVLNPMFVLFYFKQKRINESTTTTGRHPAIADLETAAA